MQPQEEFTPFGLLFPSYFLAQYFETNSNLMLFSRVVVITAIYGIAQVLAQGTNPACVTKANDGRFCADCNTKGCIIRPEHRMSL